MYVLLSIPVIYLITTSAFPQFQNDAPFLSSANDVNSIDLVPPADDPAGTTLSENVDTVLSNNNDEQTNEDNSLILASAVNDPGSNISPIPADDAATINLDADSFPANNIGGQPDLIFADNKEQINPACVDKVRRDALKNPQQSRSSHPAAMKPC